MKTKLEALTELRDRIFSRLVENEANLEYWKLITSKKRANSDKYLVAKDKIAINEEGIKEDKVFLQVIDGMIKRLN